ncbi:phosphatidylserine decarboxylase [Derxia gummosa]|uniref:Phosphatidylserine decarboxylase n=1 Tax=Derxia gummosa DSM 723 TaxID=1121388 RepID=A0A8B6X1J9_9BURK|nr:phosphatidylserine decarboxylase [Derxia gummosa]
MDRQQRQIRSEVVRELIGLVEKYGWHNRFAIAIESAQRANIPEMADIRALADYYFWIDDLLHWVPSEDEPGRKVYNHICKFYFVLDQPSVRELQNRVVPHETAAPLTPLSAWMVQYARALGKFLDTPESLTPESLASFRASPNYNMDDYIVPHGGWKTFNQFFARNFKPGRRPIAAIADDSVIVSPADSTFAGQWEIRPDSGVTVKNLHWQVSELLAGSPYRDRFTNGMFMHAFLNTTDYHRQHAPVGGTVVEARVIPGQVYLDVVSEPIAGDAEGARRLRPVRSFDAEDGTGYQFAQARGLVVIDSPIGLVAVLPIGMAQVSSVVLTAEVGATLRKGEEISYFQFGGSDIVVLFEARSNVSFTAQPNVHHKVGVRIAQAFPA